MIKINNIRKVFKEEPVLENISFEVKSGEIIGLVGPNGAGKTTLLNIISGIWLPSGGSVAIDGYDINDIKRTRRIMGYIPDSPFLYPKLTGREFLVFVGTIYKVSSEELEIKITETARALEISFWLDGLMESFPRGVRQKMVLAAMLLHSPRVLLLDEPTANLDPKSACLVRDLLQNLAKKGAAVLISTHILEIAEKLCQRLVILDKGKIIADGTMQDLRNIARNPEYNLEEIFLRLTGGESYTELLKYLS